MNDQSLSCSPASAGRIAALDAARGFAILAVVASHALLLQEPVASWIYEFYVPLFFVLSGYLASPGHEVTRIGRMAGKYLGVCGTLFAVWFVMYPLRGEQTDLTGRAVASILYGRFYDTASPLLVNCCWSGQLWFLTLLCTASALFFALRRLPDHPAVRIAVLAGLLAAAQLLRAAPVLLPWCVDTAPLGAAYMLAGSWLARRDFARKPFRGWHPALLAACLAAYLALHDTYDLNLRVYGRFADLRGPAAFLRRARREASSALPCALWLCASPGWARSSAALAATAWGCSAGISSGCGWWMPCGCGCPLPGRRTASGCALPMPWLFWRQCLCSARGRMRCTKLRADGWRGKCTSANAKSDEDGSPCVKHKLQNNPPSVENSPHRGRFCLSGRKGRERGYALPLGRAFQNPCNSKPLPRIFVLRMPGWKKWGLAQICRRKIGTFVLRVL